jgi:hypothetical protein
MADILKFTGFNPRDALAELPSFLHELDAERAINAAGWVARSSNASRDVASSACEAATWRDWTNQELADLYRVEALLLQANVRIETARGVSDEGDPWFVFCHGDGDVFAHLCRIDGIYMLDGPGLDTVLRGTSFSALIDRFASILEVRAATGNIVRFRPGSTNSVVRLHPAVMLAALLWSFYLASDHFVGSAQAGELDTTGDDHSALLLGPTSIATADGVTDKTPTRFDNGSIHKFLLADSHRVDGGTSYWNMTNSTTGIAAGLTAIAISFGLYDSKSPGLEYKAAGIATTDATYALPGQHDSTGIDETIVHSRDLLTTREAAKTEPDEGTLQPVVHAQDAHAQLKIEVHIEDVAHVAAATEVAPAPTTHKIQVVEATSSQSTTAIAKLAMQDDAHDLQFLITLATEHLGQISTYKLADLSVDATFDVSTLSEQTAQLVLADLAGQAENTGKASAGHAEMGLEGVPHADAIARSLPYDDEAKSFVYQFLLKSHSIEMIKSDNKVVFVDTSAVDEPSDHAYSVSWVSNDHTIVSTIGHAQDFAGYLLS